MNNKKALHEGDTQYILPEVGEKTYFLDIDICTRNPETDDIDGLGQTYVELSDRAEGESLLDYVMNREPNNCFRGWAALDTAEANYVARSEVDSFEEAIDDADVIFIDLVEKAPGDEHVIKQVTIDLVADDIWVD